MNNNKHSYIVRFARERIDTPWRIIVKSSLGNETHYFTDIVTLSRFFVDNFPEIGMGGNDLETVTKYS